MLVLATHEFALFVLIENWRFRSTKSTSDSVNTLTTFVSRYSLAV